MILYANPAIICDTESGESIPFDDAGDLSSLSPASEPTVLLDFNWVRTKLIEPPGVDDGTVDNYLRMNLSAIMPYEPDDVVLDYKHLTLRGRDWIFVGVAERGPFNQLKQQLAEAGIDSAHYVPFPLPMVKQYTESFDPPFSLFWAETGNINQLNVPEDDPPQNLRFPTDGNPEQTINQRIQRLQQPTTLVFGPSYSLGDETRRSIQQECEFDHVIDETPSLEPGHFFTASSDTSSSSWPLERVAGWALIVLFLAGSAWFQWTIHQKNQRLQSLRSQLQSQTAQYEKWNALAERADGENVDNGWVRFLNRLAFDDEAIRINHLDLRRSNGQNYDLDRSVYEISIRGTSTDLSALRPGLNTLTGLLDDETVNLEQNEDRYQFDAKGVVQ